MAHNQHRIWHTKRSDGSIPLQATKLSVRINWGYLYNSMCKVHADNVASSIRLLNRFRARWAKGNKNAEVLIEGDFAYQAMISI